MQLQPEISQRVGRDRDTPSHRQKWSDLSFVNPTKSRLSLGQRWCVTAPLVALCAAVQARYCANGAHISTWISCVVLCTGFLSCRTLSWATKGASADVGCWAQLAGRHGADGAVCDRSADRPGIPEQDSARHDQAGGQEDRPQGCQGLRECPTPVSAKCGARSFGWSFRSLSQRLQPSSELGCTICWCTHVLKFLLVQELMVATCTPVVACLGTAATVSCCCRNHQRPSVDKALTVLYCCSRGSLR